MHGLANFKFIRHFQLYYVWKISFSILCLGLIHRRCRLCFLHLVILSDTHTHARMHTHTHTHTLGKITLDSASARSQRPLPAQHTTFTRDKYPCPGEIWTRNSSKREAANPRLRPQGHWNWSKEFFFFNFIRQIHLDNLECHLIGYDIVQNGRSFQTCGRI
jgi:hypothetical protein